MKGKTKSCATAQGSSYVQRGVGIYGKLSEYSVYSVEAKYGRYIVPRGTSNEISRESGEENTRLWPKRI